jgi:hypothetical protein
MSKTKNVQFCCVQEVTANDLWELHISQQPKAKTCSPSSTNVSGVYINKCSLNEWLCPSQNVSQVQITQAISFSRFWTTFEWFSERIVSTDTSISFWHVIVSVSYLWTFCAEYNEQYGDVLHSYIPWAKQYFQYPMHSVLRMRSRQAV